MEALWPVDAPLGGLVVTRYGLSADNLVLCLISGGDTLKASRAKGMKLSDHLDRNDAYGFFDALGALLIL